MNVFKRCDCTGSCRHPFWYRFRLHGSEHRGSTRTANRLLAERIAAKRQTEALEGSEGLRKRTAPLLSIHVKEYLKVAEKEHRTHDKDEQVLKGLVSFLGDKRLDQIRSFDIERWKTARAEEVSRSTVNRELNVIRGCFSRG